MSDATPKKATKKPKSKKPAAHPKYSQMIKAAIIALKDRTGSSRQAILKYIMANYKVVDERAANQHLKMALRGGVANKSLKQSKGTGASGSFRLGEVKKAAAKPKAKAAKKPPKKKTAKKTSKSPKKAAKKPAAKKAATKPKAKKSPAKKKPAKKAKAAKK